MIYREDRMWKSIISAFPAEFVSFMHPDAAKTLDLTRMPELMDKEFQPLQGPAPDSGQLPVMIVDNLLKVYTLGGGNDFILMHIEVQQIYSAVVAERMLRYAYRIFDKFQKRVTAWLILTESSGQRRAAVFAQRYMGTSIQYRFNSLKIVNMTDEDLLSRDNPFAVIFMAARLRILGKKIKTQALRTAYLMKEKMKLAKLLFSLRLDPEKQKEILNFIDYAIHLENEQDRVKFENYVSILTNKAIDMTITETIMSFVKEEGKLKGMEEGEIKGRREVAKELKERNISIDLIAEVTKLSIQEIEALSPN